MLITYQMSTVLNMLITMMSCKHCFKLVLLLSQIIKAKLFYFKRYYYFPNLMSLVVLQHICLNYGMNYEYY